MACKDAMVTEVISVKRDTTVSDILQIFYNNRIRNVPVLEEDGVLAGVISFRRLLAHLLPVPVKIGEDLKRFKHLSINLDHLAGQAPWVTRRLGDLLYKTAEDVMFENPEVVHPETTLREGIRKLYEFESPLPVVEEGTGKLCGLISSQSAIQALFEIRNEILEEKNGK